MSLSPLGVLPVLAAETESTGQKVAEGLQLVYGSESLADEDAFILLMFGDGFTAVQQDTRNTYFGSTFWSGGMQRLLTVPEAGLTKVKT